MKRITSIVCFICLVCSPQAFGVITAFPPPPDSAALEAVKLTLSTGVENVNLARNQLRNANLAHDTNRITAASGMITAANDDLVKREIQAIGELLDQMQKGVVMVRWVEKTLELSQLMQLTTNPWADEEIKNSFDHLRDWGTVIGVVVTAAAFAIKDDDTKKALGTAGLSSASISQLLGILLGKDSGKKAAEKTSFLALTVRAYDDLVAKNNLTKYYLKGNKDFHDKVKDLNAKFKAADDNQKLSMAKDTMELVERFDDILKEYPELMKGYQSLADQYVAFVEKEPALLTSEFYKTKLKPNLEAVATKSREVIEFYDLEVEPIIALSRSAKDLLLLAELQRTALSN